MAGGGEVVGQYSQRVALVFIFNLIVGAGALTIPAAFSKAGLYLGTVLVIFIAFLSYMCATFVLEIMACSNALILENNDVVVEGGATSPNGGEDKVAAVLALIGEQESGTEMVPRADGAATSETLRNRVGTIDVSTAADGVGGGGGTVVLTDTDDDALDAAGVESAPLMISKRSKEPSEGGARPSSVEGGRFDIRTKVEMTVMAEQFLGHRGVVLFYWCIIAYLYGDLVIYAVAVPKSLREMICARPAALPTDSAQPWPCLGSHDSDDVYRACCWFFSATFAPWVFFNVTQTKLLQIITTVMRYMAFTIVIVLAVKGINEGEASPEPPVLADFSALPTLFGVTIYSFMCHHSIPSLVMPITVKRNLGSLFAKVFAFIVMLYLLVGYTATVRFGKDEIQDIYTLNFAKYKVRAVGFFLSVFPVLTMSSIFPIISITLRENLKAMLHQQVSRAITARGGGEYAQRMAVNVGFPLLTVVPPVALSFFTQDVAMLVGITGSYAGMAIQWLFPAWIVWRAREFHHLRDPSYPNEHKSIFQSQNWIFLIFIWSGLCFCFITWVHVMEAMGTPISHHKHHTTRGHDHHHGGPTGD